MSPKQCVFKKLFSFVSLKMEDKGGLKKGIIFTSSVLYAPYVADGFGHISFCCFDQGLLPGQNIGIERDESKVIFIVEVIQNGLQSSAGLCKRRNMMSSHVWGEGKEGRTKGQLETVSPAPSSAHSLSRFGRSQTRRSSGPWADLGARRSGRSGR